MQLIPWHSTDPCLVAPFFRSALQRIIAHTNFDTEDQFHDLFVWPLSESRVKQLNYRTSILAAIKVAVGRVTLYSGHVLSYSTIVIMLMKTFQRGTQSERTDLTQKVRLICSQFCFSFIFRPVTQMLIVVKTVAVSNIWAYVHRKEE